MIGTVLYVCVRPRHWGRAVREAFAQQVLAVGVEPLLFVCGVAVLVGISVVVQLAFWTGEAGQSQLLGPSGGRFFLDAGCTHPDPLWDDQALYLETEGGLVVILGCAHSGVVNTLTYIRELTNKLPLYTVIGGMHLLTAGPERMQATIDAFRDWAPKRILPEDCTGLAATSELWRALPGCVSACPTGTRLTL